MKTFILLPLLTVAAMAQTATTIHVSASPNPATLGQSVTLTATVTGIASGTVTFYDGISPIAVAAISLGTSTAKTSLLAGGTHCITASLTEA